MGSNVMATLLWSFLAASPQELGGNHGPAVRPVLRRLPSAPSATPVMTTAFVRPPTQSSSTSSSSLKRTSQPLFAVMNGVRTWNGASSTASSTYNNNNLNGYNTVNGYNGYTVNGYNGVNGAASGMGVPYRYSTNYNNGRQNRFYDQTDELILERFLDAASKNNLREVDRLLDLGAVDVNDQDANGCTALIWACICGHANVAQYLLQHPQIDLNVRMHDGYTALHWALMDRRLNSVVRQLVAKPDVQVNLATTKERWTPLHVAVREGVLQNLQYLLAHPAIDTTLQDQDGLTAYDMARQYNRKSMERELERHMQQENQEYRVLEAYRNGGLQNLMINGDYENGYNSGRGRYSNGYRVNNNNYNNYGGNYGGTGRYNYNKNNNRYNSNYSNNANGLNGSYSSNNNRYNNANGLNGSYNRNNRYNNGRYGSNNNNNNRYWETNNIRDRGATQRRSGAITSSRTEGSESDTTPSFAQTVDMPDPSSSYKTSSSSSSSSTSSRTSSLSNNRWSSDSTGRWSSGSSSYGGVSSRTGRFEEIPWQDRVNGDMMNNRLISGTPTSRAARQQQERLRQQQPSYLRQDQSWRQPTTTNSRYTATSSYRNPNQYRINDASSSSSSIQQLHVLQQDQLETIHALQRLQAICGELAVENENLKKHVETLHVECYGWQTQTQALMDRVKMMEYKLDRLNGIR